MIFQRAESHGEEIFKFDKEQIREWQKASIILPHVSPMPENLWLWLERTPASAFKLTSRQINKRREKAFVRAGLLVTAAMARKDKIAKKSPPKNCLRHSFATYHVALHRDPGYTALLISHKNQTVLYEHYLGVATKKDAREYFEINTQLI